ncbi:MAG: PepSY domain-containing protein [Hyphomonas sp.]
MKRLSATLIAIAMSVPASFALAQGAGSDTISREQAIEIAEKKGMVHVLEIELDDGEWEIEGCNAEGRELEIDVHSRTGEILKYDLDRDKDDDCAIVLR